MTSLSKVVISLRHEYARLEKQMGKVERALDALGPANGNRFKGTKRVLSKAARERIAEAQRRRWAKARKQAA